MSRFDVAAFFDLTLTPDIAPLFSHVLSVWEAISLVPSFIENSIKPEILGEIEEGAWLEPNRVYLGRGSRVERGAVVRGPTIIGDNTTVRSGAHIRGHVFTGNHCLIGTGTEVHNTVLMNYSNLPHQNLIFSSIIGSHVNLGGQTTIANRRLDDAEVIIRINEQAYPTGSNRFGAIIGDYTESGVMSVFQPGSIVGMQCIIYPFGCVQGCLPSNTIFKYTYEPILITRKQDLRGE